MKCATRLHKFGYRIPQVRGESSQKENASEKDKLLEELLDSIADSVFVKIG